MVKEGLEPNFRVLTDDMHVGSYSFILYHLLVAAYSSLPPGRPNAHTRLFYRSVNPTDFALLWSVEELLSRDRQNNQRVPLRSSSKC